MRSFHHRVLLWGLGIGLLAAGPASGEAPDAWRRHLEQRADVIKPADGELKWQQIPWLLDLAEGERLAREENRPIFLWVTGDDPLERC